MPERVFVTAIRQYCARHGIEIDVRADGWLIAMARGPQRHFAFGYDIGLNSSIAHRLANDKSATAEVLVLAGVPCIPHRHFIDPRLVPAPGAEETMRALLMEHPQGLVLKPNEGTAGRLVIRVTTEPELRLAVEQIFNASQALVISPYVEIEEEVRVILLDATPMVVYRKERPSVVGDGTRTMRELARAAGLETRLGEVTSDQREAVVPNGERRILTWRHNLDAGAKPVLIEHGDIHAVCAAIAVNAARAIGIAFTSIDIVRVSGVWRVLEINSGVMMEALGKLYPELAHATYGAALDRVFGEPHGR
ncbi:RimK-like protein [Bradyrhizobium guangdongense]|uniref:ATP-grasp domain-containing protein n=1 Tax=Bradyrhizobium guangdongense TaxID=1325090 RepID=UPI0016427039